MLDPNLYVTCPKCGKRNPLGRVFCMDCGNRLPADGLVSGDLQKMAKSIRFRRWLARLLVVGMLLAFVGGAIQAFRPPKQYHPLGGEHDARQFEQLFRSFRVIDDFRAQGFSIEQNLSDEQINAFLRLRPSDVDSDADYRIRFSASGMHVQRVHPLKLPFGLGAYGMPSIVFEILYVKHNGKLLPDDGRLGQLSLPAPLRDRVATSFLRDLRNRSEWSVLRHLRCVALDEGSITLALDPDA